VLNRAAMTGWCRRRQGVLREGRVVLSAVVCGLVVDVHSSDPSVGATTLGDVTRRFERWSMARADRHSARWTRDGAVRTTRAATGKKRGNA